MHGFVMFEENGGKNREQAIDWSFVECVGGNVWKVMVVICLTEKPQFSYSRNSFVHLCENVTA